MFPDLATPRRRNHLHANLYALGRFLAQTAVYLRPGIPIDQVPARARMRTSAASPDR